MKRILTIFALAALAVLSSSCGASRAEQMKMADNVKINCNPEVLALVGDKIPADITVTYPDGYFSPKAVMVVTPVLVYGNKECAAMPFAYQGEKIQDNKKVIPSTGGTVKEHVEFTYEEGMEKCQLELRSIVYYGKKTIEVPAIKVADGLITTSRLACTNGEYAAKADAYQDVITSTTEGQILYDVNSANVKGSELRSQSIKELKEALSAIAADPRYTVKGTQVVAYASPEGGQAYNAKLSDKRAASAEKAWAKISGNKADEVETKSIGQDWEGFQEAVENSNIEDKDLILRVLSMYSDPAIREKEIRNMSQVYTEINKKVFPDLRRARFITETDYQNFTNEELQELAEKAIGTLDEEALIRVASNTENKDRKAALLKRAADVFGSDKAKFNLATLALDAKDPDKAASYLSQIKNVDGDVVNAMGVCELQKGNLVKAASLFNQAGTEQAKCNLGTIDILNGDYAEAAKKLEGTGARNEALALLLNGQSNKAEAAIKCNCACSDYLRAVIAARKGDAAAVKANLESAIKKNPELKDKAAKDAEFAKYL